MEWTVKGSFIGGIWIFPPYIPDNQGWEMNDGERILGAGKPAPFSRREYLRKYLGRYLMIFDTNEDKNEDKNFIVGKLWVRLAFSLLIC